LAAVLFDGVVYSSWLFLMAAGLTLIYGVMRILNIAHGRTRDYEGRGSLRSELRHLRSMGLIRKHSTRHIGDLTSGKTHDLADFVELTDLGRQWVAKLEN